MIPSRNAQTAEQQRGRHFQVRYDPDVAKYFIKDLGIGHGVFAKIDQPTVLKDNMIINVGEAHIVVNLLNKDESEDVTAGTNGAIAAEDETQMKSGARLKLKIFGGPTSGEIL